MWLCTASAVEGLVVHRRDVARTPSPAGTAQAGVDAVVEVRHVEAVRARHVREVLVQPALRCVEKRSLPSSKAAAVSILYCMYWSAVISAVAA